MASNLPRSLGLLLGGMCVTACGAAREAGPHARPLQQPVEPACATDVVPLSSTGLTVSTRFERQTRTRARITNRGARTRIVVPQSISLCVGPCAGYFAECRRLESFGEGDEPALAVTLAPGELLELDVDAALGAQQSACEKVALVAVLDVDSTRTCGDIASFIALSR